jgi:hypothetical protein
MLPFAVFPIIGPKPYRIIALIALICTIYLGIHDHKAGKNWRREHFSIPTQETGK